MRNYRDSICDWFRPIEDPQRIRIFRRQVEALSWDEQDVVPSQRRLAEYINDLVEAEIQYYYWRRCIKRCLSWATRGIGWGFGTLGIVIPLLAGAGAPVFEEYSAFGYIFVAIAASAFALNSLFDGTKGHARYVSTQLKLEKLLVAFNVAWASYLSEGHKSHEQQKRGFDLLLSHVEALHASIGSETKAWSEEVEAAMKHYKKETQSP